MQAVILAAGKGTRMYPLTIDKPKPLVEVANKPVLEHNLDQMLGIVEEAIIVVGYKKDMIIDRFGNNYMGMKLTYVVQEEQLGTGHALLQTEQKIKGKFLVLNGDDLFSRKDMERLTKYDNCILLKKKKNVMGFGVVVVKDGKVTDIIEKPKEFISNLVNVGLYCFSEEVFEILKNLRKTERGEYEIPDAVKELAKKGKMYYEEVQGYWIPVGYPWQILDATEELLEDKGEISIKGKLEEGVTIEGSVEVGENSVIGKGTLLKGNVVIGKNCQIKENCMLCGFTAIADNTIIENNVELDNVIIGESSRIDQDCILKDSVLGDKAELSKGVKIENRKGEGTIKVKSNGEIHDSGRNKLGVIVKNGVKVCEDRLNCSECVTK